MKFFASLECSLPHCSQRHSVKPVKGLAHPVLCGLKRTPIHSLPWRSPEMEQVLCAGCPLVEVGVRARE